MLRDELVYNYSTEWNFFKQMGEKKEEMDKMLT